MRSADDQLPSTNEASRVCANHSVTRRFFARSVAALALPTILKARPARAAEEFTFGLTPVLLTSDLNLLEKIASYLETSMGRPVRLVTRRTYQEITSLLVSEQLDAAWVCGYPFVANRARMELVAVPVWRGRPLYQSYLIVDREREVQGIDDLRGDVHAFSDPDSNSGFLVTRTLLAKRHTRPEEFFRKSFFTYSHRNVVRAVASGLAESGSVDGYVWEVMTETEPDLTTKTHVASRSEWLGFPPVATSVQKAGTPAIQAFQKALVDMDNHRLGQEALALLRLERFGVFDPSLFDPIAAEMDLVRRSG
jgi:phosphonate transport system substrate-binding protein